MIEALVATITHTRGMTLKLVADLADDQLATQPAPKTNHPAWVLGHLLQVDHAFLSLINPAAPAPAYLDQAWKDTYGAKSAPVADKAAYRGKDFYVSELAKVREQIITRLRSMDEADFEKAHPDPARRDRFPTVGHAVFLYGTWHEAYHAGQLSTWRRVQGLPAV